MGLQGLVISDHNGVTDLVQHGVARDHREAARLAIRAGIDMSMNDSSYGPELPGLLESGAVSQSNIDDAVREVLGAKYDMGLFEDPYRRIGIASEDPRIPTTKTVCTERRPVKWHARRWCC